MDSRLPYYMFFFLFLNVFQRKALESEKASWQGVSRFPPLPLLASPAVRRAVLVRATAGGVRPSR